MLPPRGDYSQEHRQHKRRDPHRERMRVDSKISDDFPSWWMKCVRWEAGADCESITFETHKQETHTHNSGEAHRLPRRQIPKDATIRNRGAISSKRDLPGQNQKYAYTTYTPVECTT